MMTEEKFSKRKGTGFTGCPTGYFEQHSFGRRTKKILKNLLLFALMNASGNETVTNRNFIKLVNKLFKKFLIQIIKKLKTMMTTRRLRRLWTLS